jgi:hypothetical protein
MAISNNPLMNGVTGSINKQIVYRQYFGKTIISVHPDMSHRKLSPKQIARNELMKEVNGQIKAIKADEQKRNEAQLRLNVPLNGLHHALLSELLKDKK